MPRPFSASATFTNRSCWPAAVSYTHLGNTHQPLLRDPQPIHEADYVVMESTYGDRSHGPRPDYVPALAAVLQYTFDPVSYTHLNASSMFKGALPARAKRLFFRIQYFWMKNKANC